MQPGTCQQGINGRNNIDEVFNFVDRAGIRAPINEFDKKAEEELEKH